MGCSGSSILSTLSGAARSGWTPADNNQLTVYTNIQREVFGCNYRSFLPWVLNFTFTRTLPKPLLSYGKYVGTLHRRLFSTKILMNCSCKYAYFSPVTVILSVCLTCWFHTPLCSPLLYINSRLNPAKYRLLLDHAESLSLPAVFKGLQGAQHLAGLSPEFGQQPPLWKTKQTFWNKVRTAPGQHFVQWIFIHLD